MESERCGGLGEVAPMELPYFAAQYRFFLHPMRWTSLGLAVCEAMMIGMPILGLATTELRTVVRDGESGFIATDPGQLVAHGRRLLDDGEEARRLGRTPARWRWSGLGFSASNGIGQQRFEAAVDWEPEALRSGRALKEPAMVTAP